jgi:hypothetical protein
MVAPHLFAQWRNRHTRHRPVSVPVDRGIPMHAFCNVANGAVSSSSNNGVEEPAKGSVGCRPLALTMGIRLPQPREGGMKVPTGGKTCLWIVHDEKRLRTELISLCCTCPALEVHLAGDGVREAGRLGLSQVFWREIKPRQRMPRTRHQVTARRAAVAAAAVDVSHVYLGWLLIPLLRLLPLPLLLQLALPIHFWRGLCFGRTAAFKLSCFELHTLAPSSQCMPTFSQAALVSG